jgi:hypothetical protein
VAELANGPDDRPIEQQLRELIDRVLEFLSREMPCMTALSESGFPVEQIFDRSETPPPFRSIWALGSWLKRAQQRGLIDIHAIEGSDFEGVATGLLGALHGRVFLSDFLGASYWRRSRDEYVADIARIYARALAPNSRATLKPKLQKTATRLANTLRKRKKS